MNMPIVDKAKPTGQTAGKRGFQHLVDDHARLALAQQVCGVGSWEMRADNGDIALSPQAQEILGEELGRPCLNNLLALVAENDRLRLLKSYSDALESAGIIEIEHSLTPRNGQRRQLRQRMRRAPVSADGKPRLLGTLQDVTDYKASSQALRDSERTFRLLMAHAPHGIALLDGDGNFIEVNGALCELLGYPPEALKGRNFRDFTHADDLPAADNLLAQISNSESTHLRYEKRYQHRDGSTIWVEVNLSAQHDDNGNTSLLVAHIQDLTARKNEETEIRRQVFTDPLTGLPNRRMFMDRLELTWNQAQRHDRSFAIIYLDLDDFKPINDRLGHAAGDALLIEVARRLIDCTRASDTVARIGGDEFVVLLAEISERSAPGRIAEKILHKLSEPVDANGHPLSVRASLGVVSHASDRFGSPIAMLNAADSAMYSAKRTGGGRYQHCHHTVLPQA